MKYFLVGVSRTLPQDGTIMVQAASERGALQKVHRMIKQKKLEMDDRRIDWSLPEKDPDLFDTTEEVIPL